MEIRAVGDGLPGAHLCAGGFVLCLLLRCRLQQQCLFSSPTQPRCVCHAKGSPCLWYSFRSLCVLPIQFIYCSVCWLCWFFYKGKGKCWGGKMHKSKQKHPIVSITFCEKKGIFHEYKLQVKVVCWQLLKESGEIVLKCFIRSSDKNLWCLWCAEALKAPCTFVLLSLWLFWTASCASGHFSCFSGKRWE